MKRIVSIFLLFFPFFVFAQNIKTVSGEYVYYPPDTESYEVAKAKALYFAQIRLLADTFGTVVSSSAAMVISNDGNHSKVENFSIGESEVKGEWLETIGEPEYSRFLDDSDVMAIKVKVKGKVRELLPSRYDYQAKILKNGMGDRYESMDFMEGDDLYMSFAASSDGYLAVYLYDGEYDVCRLFPYLSMDAGCYRIKGSKRYVLFSSECPEPPLLAHEVDEFCMTCGRSIELNRIYVVFSPNAFAGIVSAGKMSCNMPYTDFQKWLSRLRIKDADMKVKTFDITVKKRN